LNDLFDQKYGKGKFETCIISDITTQVEWKGAIDGITGIIHVVRRVPANRLDTWDPELTYYRPLIYR